MFMPLTEVKSLKKIETATDIQTVLATHVGAAYSQSLDSVRLHMFFTDSIDLLKSFYEVGNMSYPKDWAIAAVRDFLESHYRIPPTVVKALQYNLNQDPKNWIRQTNAVNESSSGICECGGSTANTRHSSWCPVTD